MSKAFELCLAILEASGQDQSLSGKQRKNFEKCRDYVRVRAEKLDPVTINKLARKVAEDVDTTASFYIVYSIFESKDEEVDRSVALINLINDERLKMASRSRGGNLSGPAFRGLNFILGILILTNSTTWKNFLEQVFAGCEAALSGFKRLVHLWKSFDVKICPVDSGTWTLDYQKIAVADRVAYGFDNLTVNLPIPSQQLAGILLFIGKIINDKQNSNQEIFKLATWYKVNVDYFTQLEKEMRQELIDRPKYPVRPNGLDKMKISICDQLRGFVQLFPSEDFPNFQAKVWIWSDFVETWECYSYDFIEASQELAMDNLWEVFELVLRFSAAYCFWWLVTGQGKKESKAVGSTSVARRQSNEEGSVVRGHFRRLPNGHVASDEAVRLVKEKFLIELPVGMTFVGSYNRGVSELEIKEFEKIPALPGFDFSFRQFGFNPG
ncbi:hypothetical protein KC644_04335 [Candidatus Berkelbacteria bacterium]|nr:hypothetical protein [Candidatus Berkelbacteria bacterium]